MANIIILYWGICLYHILLYLSNRSLKKKILTYLFPFSSGHNTEVSQYFREDKCFALKPRTTHPTYAQLTTHIPYDEIWVIFISCFVIVVSVNTGCAKGVSGNEENIDCNIPASPTNDIKKSTENNHTSPKSFCS